jgi:N-methylhydantoinase A/oxoprolinase/acetone carboxylase beta subunit
VRVQIGVDIGGTFTDIVALDGSGRLALTLAARGTPTSAFTLRESMRAVSLAEMAW